MLRLVVADPAATLRAVAEAGKQRSAGIKRTVQPRSLTRAATSRPSSKTIWSSAWARPEPAKT